MPGGVAVFAKLPLTIHKLQVADLAEWEKQGRALAAVISSGQETWTCVVSYGFAASHPQHGLNEVMLPQIALWGARLKMPLIWGG